MAKIRPITAPNSELSVTRQQEFELLQDVYTGTLDAAAQLHNSRHPVKVEYRTKFITGSEESPFHILNTELCIDGTWHMLSRHHEKVSKNDRMIPRLVVYRRALAELASMSLIMTLSSKVDPVTLAGGLIPAGDEATIIPLFTDSVHSDGFQGGV